jgi:hypothetical protein
MKYIYALIFSLVVGFAQASPPQAPPQFPPVKTRVIYVQPPVQFYQPPVQFYQAPVRFAPAFYGNPFSNRAYAVTPFGQVIQYQRAPLGERLLRGAIFGGLFGF